MVVLISHPQITESARKTCGECHSEDTKIEPTMRNPEDRSASEILLSTSSETDFPQLPAPPPNPSSTAHVSRAPEPDGGGTPPLNPRLLSPPRPTCDIEGEVLSAMRSGDTRAFSEAIRRHDDAHAAASAALTDTADATSLPALSRCVSACCSVPRLAPFLPALLRARGVRPNAPLRHRAAGATPLPPLHAAAASSNPGALAALLDDPRIDTALLDDARRTALHHAVVPRREECLERARACVLLLLGEVPARTWAGDTGEGVVMAGEPCYAALHHQQLERGRGQVPGRRALLDVDAADVYECTALHYAARYADHSIVLTLLRCGAFYGVHDRYGHSAIVDIGACALETHLDECLKSKNAKSPYDYMYTMIYNFTFLPSSPSHVSYKCKRMSVPDSESCSSKSFTYASEMDVLFELSTLRCSRHLLKHPVITLFLNMKWHRIKYIIYCNIVIYMMFLVLLNYHIITRPNTWCLSSKWTNMSEFTIESANNRPKCEDRFHVILEILLIACLLLFVAREGLQIMISCRKHIHNIELYVKFFLTAFTVAALVLPNNKARQHVSALAVLLSWIGLFFLTGNMPLLSIQLEMLKRVCVTFVKFMTWYSILVFGFSFSFCILLNNGEDFAKGSVHSFFLDPWRAIFKTIIMMAGEFDAVDLPLQTYPITSHIIFIIFVFLISIVLLNLLNGLAVSDTQSIKEEAEVFSLVARVRTISQIESSLLHIRNSKILRLLTLLPGVQSFYDNIFIFPFFHHIKQIRVYPNWKENNVIISRPNDTNEYAHCCNWTFKRSLDAAVHLIMKNKKSPASVSLCVEMKKMRTEMKEWMRAVERRLHFQSDSSRRRGHRFSRRSHASTKTF